MHLLGFGHGSTIGSAMAINLNIGSIWTMISGTILAVVYMFTSFVGIEGNNQYHDSQNAAIETYHATQLEEQGEFRLSIYYDQYYSLLKDYNTAMAAGQTAYAEELSRQMERIKAKICEADPEWERCDE